MEKANHRLNGVSIEFIRDDEMRIDEAVGIASLIADWIGLRAERKSAGTSNVQPEDSLSNLPGGKR